MVFTNEEAMTSLLVLSQLEEKGMLGYAIARNRQKLADEVQQYSAKRDDLLKEYGKDKGNGQFELERINAARFYEALRPYSELTFEVPVMQITPEVFCSGNLTSSQMFVLNWMVKD